MKLVFIDLDGTIEDSRQDMVESVNSVRLDLDLDPLDEDEVRPNVMKGMEHLYRTSFPELFGQDDSDEDVLARLSKLYEHEYGRNITEHTHAYDGIPAALERLSEIATLCVYTNKPQALSRKLLTELGLSRYVRFIVGADSFPQSKPAPEPMQQVASDCDFDPANDQVYMVGDSTGDMQAAKNFAAVGVWCAWGYYATAPTDPAPAHTIEHPGDLVKLLES